MLTSLKIIIIIIIIMYLFFLNNLGDLVTRRKKYFWYQKKSPWDKNRWGRLTVRGMPLDFTAVKFLGKTE